MSAQKTADTLVVPMNSKQRREAQKAQRAASAKAAAERMAPTDAGEQTPDPVVEPKPVKVALPKLPKMKRVRKPKTPKPCSCGCGHSTRGGRFIPGHDSRLKGWLLRVERGLVKIEDIPTTGEQAAVRAHLNPVKATE